MPTDISVSVGNLRRGASRAWLASPHGDDLPKHAVYDFALFTHANFTTNATYGGYIPNGTVLGQVTASKKFGPYDPGATDGRQTAVGFAFNDTKLPAAGQTPVVTDAYLSHCGVRVNALPYQSGPGSLDANARTALRNVVFYG